MEVFWLAWFPPYAVLCLLCCVGAGSIPRLQIGKYHWLFPQIGDFMLIDFCRENTWSQRGPAPNRDQQWMSIGPSASDTVAASAWMQAPVQIKSDRVQHPATMSSVFSRGWMHVNNLNARLAASLCGPTTCLQGLERLFQRRLL